MSLKVYLLWEVKVEFQNIMKVVERIIEAQCS